MIEEVKKELVKSFGKDILNGENIDRKEIEKYFLPLD